MKVCPHCGYCEHCGRGGNTPIYPTYPYIFPLPYTPTITWGNGTIRDNTTDKVFVNIKQED